MTHYELCRAAAAKFVKSQYLALWEYQSFACSEFPDVLVYTKQGGTVLYEIKMSRADFLADSKKDARIKYKNRIYPSWAVKTKDNQLRGRIERIDMKFRIMAPELYYIEKPHLGSRRYFVCPSGLISPDELPAGWGLYWYKDGKFYRKKESGNFRPDVHAERNILAHAFRRYASGGKTGILVNVYGDEKETVYA